jgi:hypothetical protein
MALTVAGRSASARSIGAALDDWLFRVLDRAVARSGAQPQLVRDLTGWRSMRAKARDEVHAARLPRSSREVSAYGGSSTEENLDEDHGACVLA